MIAPGAVNGGAPVLAARSYGSAEGHGDEPGDHHGNGEECNRNPERSASSPTGTVHDCDHERKEREDKRKHGGLLLFIADRSSASAVLSMLQSE
jgi:hypothetical protein